MCLHLAAQQLYRYGLFVAMLSWLYLARKLREGFSMGQFAALYYWKSFWYFLRTFLLRFVWLIF